MSSTDILAEYLVKIGYQTDAISYVKFSDSLGRVAKKAIGVSTAVGGIAAATAAAVTSFSYNMRKMYFASELAGSSVKNMRAMEYAGKQIGVSGDAMASSIHGMAQALRLEPGLKAFLESMGVQVQGRDVSDVMVDFVGSLKGMPEYQATQIASMFGISADDYHQMATHLDDLKSKKLEHLEIQKRMGVDVDAQKAAVKEYTSMLDKFGEQIEAISDKIMIKLLPAMRSAASTTDGWMEGISYGLDHLGEEIKAWMDPSQSPIYKAITGSSSPISSAQASIGGSGSSSGLFATLEKKYGLPSGLLDSVWLQESGRGRNMVSPKGAQGHFQFMPETAKEFGLKNPFDLEESADAAARKYSGLLKRYKGDVKLAAAAYNWGEGNVSEWQKGTKAMPFETQSYMANVQGRLGADRSSGSQISINQENNYNISGSDPKQIADSVGQKQDRTWGNITRRFNQVAQ